MSFDKLKYGKDYFKYLNNPLKALCFKFGFKKCCNLKFKNSNRTINIDKIQILNITMEAISKVKKDKIDEFLKTIQQINDNNKVIIINEISYLNVYNDEIMKKYPTAYESHALFEYFYGEEYNMINYNGRYVIDVGSNTGDTSLYFAKRGANVIGFEPVKELHSISLDNLNINPDCKDKIILINRAVGEKRGKLDINARSLKSFVDKKEYYEIDVITIQDVLNEYNFKADILKMDCEGCEYEIILNNDLSMFNDIIFEYHPTITEINHKKLIDELHKQGFEVDLYEDIAYGSSLDELGIMHAHK